MKKSVKIAIYLLILLGVIHSIFTFILYKTLDINALWFFGSGLMYVFMGLYNLAAMKVQFTSISNIATILNFVAVLFTIVISYILKEPQAFVALILVIYIFIGTLKIIR